MTNPPLVNPKVAALLLKARSRIASPVETSPMEIISTPTATTRSPLRDQATLEAFIALVERSPEYGWRAGKRLGANAFVMPKEKPDPMPTKGVVSIEASFGDKGLGKAKRKRKDQAPARFTVALQVCTTVSRGVSDATFKGHAAFHEPDTALSKALELSKATKCKSPLSEAYSAFITDVVDNVARPNNLMIGFLYSTAPHEGGTYYHDRQIILADAQGLVDHRLEHAMILLGDDKGIISITLPQTTTVSNTGKSLTYAMQSRGVAHTGFYSTGWETGTLEVVRI